MIAIDNIYLYADLDALLVGAALKFSCYKEEGYCSIGLRKNGGLDIQT